MRFLRRYFFLMMFPLILAAQSKPYVILVSLDAFRWDYLNRSISPNLEKIRNEGVSALSLRPTFPTKTFPNHQSIVTGMYTENHGIVANNIDDPYTGTRYTMNDSLQVTNAKWYQGEAVWETAQRQGIKTASYFWPGSEVKLAYRHPTYFMKYNQNLPYEKSIEGVINWLQLPQEKRPHFITLYMHATDDSGHTYGPNSERTNDAIKLMDKMTGLLQKRIDDIKLKDSIDVIILSDHGMTEISKERTINIEQMISQFKCKITDEGVLMTIEPPKEKIKEVYEFLKKNENHFTTYYRETVPSYYHFSKNPLISSIVLIPDLGWSLVSNRSLKWTKESLGNHGYDNNQIDMHGIFLATGPSFKQSYHTGTLLNIDIYPLICKILGIIPRSNIDGDLNRIEFILNQAK